MDKRLIYIFILTVLMFVTGILWAGDKPKTASITLTEVILNQTQSKLTTWIESDLDSAETITPAFTEYFDASIFNNSNDSTFFNIKIDGGSDSGRVILVGAYSDNDKGTKLDTLPTNKTTLMQSVLDVDESNKYVFPFWSFILEGIICNNATVTIYIWSNKRILNWY